MVGKEEMKEEQQKVDEINMSVVGGGKYDESFPVLKQVGRISRREKSAAYWNSTKLKLPAEAAIAAAAEVVKPYYLRRKTRLIKSFHIDDNGELVIEDDDDDDQESLSLHKSSSSSSSPSEEDNVNVGSDHIHMMKSSDDDDVDISMAQETAAAPAPAPEEDQVNQQQEKDVVFYEDAQIDSVGKTQETAAEYKPITTPNEQVQNDDHGDAEERDEQHMMMRSDDDDVDKTPKQSDDEQELMINQPAHQLDMALSSMHLKILLQISPDGDTTPLEERESTTPTLAAAAVEKVCGDGGVADYFFFGTIPVLIPRPKIIPTQIPIAAAPDHDHHHHPLLININQEGREAAFLVDQPSSESESNDLVGERQAAAFVVEELQNSSVEGHGTSSDYNQTETAVELINSRTDQAVGGHTETQDHLHPTAAVIGIPETQVQKEAEEEISFGGNHYDHHFPNIDITKLKTTKRGRKLGD